MIRKQIHITEQQDEKLQKLIDETGLKQSELFRRALDGLIHNRTSWWDQVPQPVKDSINFAERDTELNRSKPHDQAQKAYKDN